MGNIPAAGAARFAQPAHIIKPSFPVFFNIPRIAHAKNAARFSSGVFLLSDLLSGKLYNVIALVRVEGGSILDGRKQHGPFYTGDNKKCF